MATGSKSEETARTIMEAALTLFRRNGFDETTMRDIAAKANVATGAAYYYFPSKEAIVMAFYHRASEEMQQNVQDALEKATGFENQLREVIRAKLDYFTPNRDVLRALLRKGADPSHPLSPFSNETKAIRDIDIASFQRLVAESGVRISRDLEPHMPEVLWFFQMGVIFFWLTDESRGQVRTRRLLELAAKIVTGLIRVSTFPLMRPVRKMALELIELVKGDQT